MDDRSDRDLGELADEDYDPDALEEAAKGMGVEGRERTSESNRDLGELADEDYDPDALEEAAKGMGVRRDR